VTTAVGVNILKLIADGIARGIERRLAAGVAAPLHVIACENAIRGSEQLKEHVYARLSPETRYRRFHSPLRRLSMSAVRHLVHVDHEPAAAQPGREPGRGDDVRVEGEQHRAAGPPRLGEGEQQPGREAPGAWTGVDGGAGRPVGGRPEPVDLHAQPRGERGGDLAVQPGVGDVVPAAHHRQVDQRSSIEMASRLTLSESV